MVDFLTLEDFNSLNIEYSDVLFWDTINIDTGDSAEFDGLKFDYLEVSRSYSGGEYSFTVQVDNLFVGRGYFLDGNGDYISGVSVSGRVVSFTADTPVVTCCLYNDMTISTTVTFGVMDYIVTGVSPRGNFGDHPFDVVVELEAVNPDYTIEGRTFNIDYGHGRYGTVECVNGTLTLQDVYSLFKVSIGTSSTSDDYWFMQYPVNEPVVVVPDTVECVKGKINTLTFHTDNPYMSLERLECVCGYPITNKTWVSDTVFSLDLDLRQNPTQNKLNLQLKYIPLGDNKYLDYRFTYHLVEQEITTLNELKTLFLNGGQAKISTDLTLNEQLTINNDVILNGKDHSIDLNGYNITICGDKTLKLQNTQLSNGVDSIIQKQGSNVEIIDCIFTNCTATTGNGSVIKCDVDITSLENTDDFTTLIKNTIFTSCDPIILHGGKLTVTGSTITGSVNDFKNPYFLYQTDGTATLIGNSFSLTGESEGDIGFNPCIFMCGETANINNRSYEELQNNEFNSFLEENSSIINVSYKHRTDTMHLMSNSGFCHCVTGKSKIFKTKVTPTIEGGG